MSPDVQGQIVVAAATLLGVLLTLGAVEYRARRSQFVAQRLEAAADLVTNARATKRSLEAVHRTIFARGIPDVFRASELADAGDQALTAPIRNYRRSFEAFDSARARVQLLYPTAINASVDRVRDAMNALFTASSEDVFGCERQLAQSVEEFIEVARRSLRA